MREAIKDLKSDILNTVDSTYAEHSDPNEEMLKESIKGVFIAGDYDYPELQDQIMKSVGFLFSEGQTPKKQVVMKNIEAVILSWRYGE